VRAATIISSNLGGRSAVGMSVCVCVIYLFSITAGTTPDPTQTALQRKRSEALLLVEGTIYYCRGVCVIYLASQQHGTRSYANTAKEALLLVEQGIIYVLHTVGVECVCRTVLHVRWSTDLITSDVQMVLVTMRDGHGCGCECGRGP
jgi:hypothetical protein